jgi:hypothetical protein
MKFHMFVYLLIPICVITVFFIIKEKRFEKLSLIDETKSPFGDIQRVLGSVKKVFDDIANGVGGVGEAIKKAFEPRIPDKKPCPEGMNDRDGSCWRDSYGRGTGRGVELEGCPHGSKDVAGTCWEGWRVTKNLGDRRMMCRDDEDQWGLLCYPKCAEGYTSVGCCICEPRDGPGIKLWPTDRYLCPPRDHPKHTKLAGVLCYRE